MLEFQSHGAKRRKVARRVVALSAGADSSSPEPDASCRRVA
jgi:hypothetical protein